MPYPRNPRPAKRVRTLPRAALLAAAVLVLPGFQTPPQNGPAILQDLHKLRVTGSVLYVAAHPDDENNELITYWARGRGYRTAYLSLTRGDGGQNVLGPELGEKLGVARTQELLAARRVDGGQQFFTRAIDFGFSKDYQEALSVWGHQQVLSDVVRIIRQFRPDVIVTRFSPEPGGTHGHHTASAVLALEAFRMAGDANAFPGHLKEGLTVWQPKRILQNVGASGGRGAANQGDLIRVDVSGRDPATGESFASIAARARAMHKTQGFDQPVTPGGRTGGSGSGAARAEAFQLLAGAPAASDIMEGVDTTWSRYSRGAEVARDIDQIIERFDPNDPAASVPALLTLRPRIPCGDTEQCFRRALLDRIIVNALGLEVHSTVTQAELVPGERFQLRHSAVVRAQAPLPLRWLHAFYPALMQRQETGIALQPGVTATREDSRQLSFCLPLEPRSQPRGHCAKLTQPFWLEQPATRGLFQVPNATLIGPAENRPSFPVQHFFQIGEQLLMVEVAAVQNAARPGGYADRMLDIIAPVSLRFPSEVRLFAPRSRKSVDVEVSAVRAGQAGTVALEVPPGWRVTPGSRAFQLPDAGSSVRFAFEVTAPAQSTQAGIGAVATVAGERFESQRIIIDYPHIPLQLLQPPARMKAVSLDLATRGQRVGYLPGAGDDVARAIEQMGYAVTTLSGSETAEQLRGLDAIVIGVRAFNVRNDLDRLMPLLFAYVENGGNLIAQYNTAGGLRSTALSPFPLRLSSDRITDEHAAPTFLAPEHAALNRPNKLTAADFEGWVQERGLYFPNQWDARFTPILAFADPGEEPVKGGLLIAQHGRGYFVYTGLSFFRQLPAGVPGAYRLFANLLALGK